jgi:ribosome-associated protein
MADNGPEIVIPERDLLFSTGRSGGPGGQNVNKVDTRVTVILDLDRTSAFSAEQKQRIRKHLANRINREGHLRVSSQKHRTQAQNKEEVLSVLKRLLSNALKRRRRRRKTKVPNSEKARRLEEKARRSRLKALRSGVDREDSS